MKNRVYCKVWGALVPTIEAIPVADYAFMAVWTQNCMYQAYWVPGSKGYLVHIAHIPTLLWNENRVNGLVWDAAVTTNEGFAVADYDFMAVWTLYCMYRHIGSVGPRAIWYIKLIYPLLYLFLDSWHHLYIFSYYDSFNSISSLANYIAKLLWEGKPRFAVALVVRGLLIVTSHTNCDVTSCPVIMRNYANADGDEQRYKTLKMQVSLTFCKIVILVE